MNDNSAVSIDRLSKAYRIWERPASRITAPLWESLGNLLPSPEPNGNWFTRRAAGQYRDFWALRDISLEISRGESIGIIGRNGSGKSTLLQIIAGTLRPTTGIAHVNGRVAALLELGSGFNPDFTGRENVYLNAAVLGLTRQEVDERFDQIAGFADIGDFINQPVKTYSSGMFVRLAFAVQTAVDPQILIVDEALSVGDIFFQQRCYERMGQLVDRGVSIILASHDLAAIQRFCSRTIVLQNGRMKFNGDATEGTKVYVHLEQLEREASFAKSAPTANSPDANMAEKASIEGWPVKLSAPPEGKGKTLGNGWARCTGLAVCNHHGEEAHLFRQGTTMSVFYEFEILHDMEYCIGCVTIRDKTTQPIHSKITLQDGAQSPECISKNSRLRFRQDIDLNIACEDYTLDISLDMLPASLLRQPGISYEDYLRSELRICERHGIASFSVRLRNETSPFQLLHFGMTGLPSRSYVQALPPAAS